MKHSITINREIEGFVYDTRSLSDVISSMVRRSEAVIKMVQCGLISDTDNFSNDVLCESLESVSCELIDIKTLTNQFHELQKGSQLSAGVTQDSQCIDQSNSIDLDIVLKAYDLCVSEMGNLKHLGSILQSIKDLTENNPNMKTIRQLSELGCYLFHDFHNCIDIEREEFELLSKKFSKNKFI